MEIWGEVVEVDHLDVIMMGKKEVKAVRERVKREMLGRENHNERASLEALQ